MGFDLKPRNRKAGGFHMGAFSWSWMLQDGCVGWVLGIGKGFKPAQFVYRNRPDGLCVAHNDGARVTATEAKEMARMATLLCDWQDTLHEQWMMQPEEKRREMEEYNSKNMHGLYSPPVRRDFIELVREFAVWAVKSGGFTIH